MKGKPLLDDEKANEREILLTVTGRKGKNPSEYTAPSSGSEKGLHYT